MGEAEARLFAAEGASVVLCDVRDDLGGALASEIGDCAEYVHLDVAVPSDWDHAVATATTRFGGLDILVNNAGIAGTELIENQTLDDFRRYLDVNIVGVWAGMKAAAPALRQSAHGGAIVNIGSTGALTGVYGQAAYIASKWAVRGLTRSAALEFGPKIRVNVVHPGLTRTPIWSDAGITEDLAEFITAHNPLGRLADPSDLAAAILFLVSSDGSYVNGIDLVVDGGQSAGLVNVAVARGASFAQPAAPN
jgi:3alpha(or 20beta)-hydroxysteroid dehydrogenase